MNLSVLCLKCKYCKYNYIQYELLFEPDTVIKLLFWILLARWHDSVVYLSVCDALHCGLNDTSYSKCRNE